MKTDELRARENFDATLRSSLQSYPERDNALDGESAPKAEGVREWYEHPHFGVFTTRDFCAEGRNALFQQFCHTPHVARRVIQAAAVRLMTTPLAFRALGRPAFTLPAHANDRYVMWQPGNQRIRRYSFDSRTIRVYPKTGFSTTGIAKEIKFRTQHVFPWIVPVLKQAGDCFDEPLLDAIPWDREPSARRRKQAFSHVQKALDVLHGLEADVISGREYAEHKRAEYAQAKAIFHEKYPGISFAMTDRWMAWATERAESLSEVRVSLTHGDFQPGNVIVARTGSPGIWLIDWEDLEIRASVYDEMTWTLRSRFARGLSKRMRAFWQRGDNEARNKLALWATEEWIWLLNCGAREGICHLPEGICTHFLETSRFVSQSL